MIFPYEIVNDSGRDTLVFVHGWPDTADLWKDLLPTFQKDYRCVLLTIPHFGPREDFLEYKSGGYELMELADMLHETILRSCAGKGPVTLVMFDWGAGIGYMHTTKYPEDVSRIISIDVGPMLLMKPKFSSISYLVLSGLLYQYRIIIAYLTARFFPSLRKFADRMVMKSILWAKGLDAVDGQVNQEEASKITADAGYLYFKTHVQTVLVFLGLKKPEFPDIKSTSDVPKQPMLFFYGSKKKRQIFSMPWLEKRIARGDQSEMVPLPAFHWVMQACPKEFTDKCLEWLKKTA